MVAKAAFASVWYKLLWVLLTTIGLFGLFLNSLRISLRCAVCPIAVPHSELHTTVGSLRHGSAAHCVPKQGQGSGKDGKEIVKGPGVQCALLFLIFGLIFWPFFSNNMKLLQLLVVAILPWYEPRHLCTDSTPVSRFVKLRKHGLWICNCYQGS